MFLFFGLALKGEALQSVEHEQAEGLKRRRIRFGARAEKLDKQQNKITNMWMKIFGLKTKPFLDIIFTNDRISHFGLDFFSLSYSKLERVSGNTWKNFPKYLCTFCSMRHLIFVRNPKAFPPVGCVFVTAPAFSITSD